MRLLRPINESMVKTSMQSDKERKKGRRNVSNRIRNKQKIDTNGRIREE